MMRTREDQSEALFLFLEELNSKGSDFFISKYMYEESVGEHETLWLPHLLQLLEIDAASPIEYYEKLVSVAFRCTDEDVIDARLQSKALSLLGTHLECDPNDEYGWKLLLDCLQSARKQKALYLLEEFWSNKRSWWPEYLSSMENRRVKRYTNILLEMF